MSRDLQKLFDKQESICKN
nr:unnamed protein product [Callosobruchus analis]